jgi:transposase-like protein
MAAGNRKNPQRADSSESQYSLMEFVRDFPDDETCLQWLWRTRHATNDEGTEAHCPRCEEIRGFRRYATKQQRQSWTCVACGLNIHPTAGTVFHKSSTSLHLWFYAMYLMTSTRCGISAKQLERELGVTYKTAWRMFTLIRNELMDQDDDVPLSGDIEMDETYMGGKPRLADKYAIRQAADAAGVSRHSAAARWADKKKTPVFGMVERGGNVAAYVVPSTRGLTMGRHVESRVLPASTVYTDEAPSYIGITRKGGYEHKRIHHAQGIYVSGDTHTNTIEGFWSLVKRGIGGTHHAVSAKWLQGYLNEYVWRYNRRNDGQAMFLSLILRAALSGR